ncbi:MAG: HAD family hydrolase [Nitrospinota bacterium]|nr:HAD family hydrolase [Nitrospinota bacterium]
MSPPLSEELARKAKGIKLFVLDVDGVLTDGRIIVNDEGVESKNFNVRDGMALAIARRKGFHLAIISGRFSRVVEHRANELGIKDVHQGVSDKLAVFNEVLKKLGIPAEEASFIGDDINDLPPMEACGFSAAPSDADEKVKATAGYVCSKPGGNGAVRELIEVVLSAQHKWGL